MIDLTRKSYLFRIPKPGDVPPGLVVVHNQVRPARRIGTRGFRIWVAPATDARIEKCPCPWAPELGEHYRVAGIPERKS